MQTRTLLAFVIFLGVGSTIHAQGKASLVQTGSSFQGRMEGQPTTELANYAAQAKHEMHQAMILSYAVNDTDINRSPATLLAEVNEALTQAQKTLEEGIRLCEKTGQREYLRYFQTLAHQVSGVQFLNSAHYVAARDEFERASELVSKSVNPELFTLVQNGLAYAQFFAGRKSQAISLMGHVAEVAGSTNDFLYPMYLYNLAWLHLHSGSFQQARTYFSRAVESSRKAGRPIWETMSRINWAVTDLLAGDNQSARAQLLKAADLARENRSLWYQHMATYYLSIVEATTGDLKKVGRHPQQTPSLTPVSRALSKPFASKVVSLMRSAFMTLQDAASGEAVSEGARVSVGKQSAEAGTVTVVPVNFAAAAGVDIGSLDLEVSFPADTLDFVEVDEIQPERISISTEAGTNRMRIRFTPAPGSENKSLPKGLIAFLIFQVKLETEPGDIALKISAKAMLARDASKRVSSLKTIDGMIRILPPRACFLYNHPPGH